MAGVVGLDRSRWLGYRWGRHGLGGGFGSDVLDDLLLLGVRSSRQAGAEQSLVQRTGVVPEIGPEGPLVNLWSVRGAPHVHRVDRLDVVRAALAPQESDEGGAAHMEAVGTVAAALRAVVTAPMSKSRASSEVTGRVPGSLVTWCERCAAHHVPDGLFRAAGCQAGLVLGPEEQRATMLYPAPEHPQEKIGHPRPALLRAYFRVNGPTTRALYRDWAGGGGELWKELDDLVRVQTDGRRYDLPATLLDEIREAPAAEGVVLVPPNDPYLRQVDRALLVTDAGRRRQVWRALSAPGTVLVDGEVAGTWRYRRGDRAVTITPFDRLSPARRGRAEDSAGLLATASGDEQPAVIWE